MSGAASRRVGFLVLCGLIAASVAPTASAQSANPSADDIVEALVPSGPRGLGMRSLRGIEETPGTETGPPSIDLYINFKLNSAELEPEALRTLRVLGQALQSPKLKESRILIVGHTDAKGSATYNQELSVRRANAVRSVLVGAFDIEADRLTAEGKGATQLKDSANPEDGINRRVEIRNVGAN
ncbi:OmpA family protein [Ancylobacter sp. TS-1]|uniref:OmpA family protein n=1 Tax=Ancylobacter sp. TS-1 TaxID=1850374 RepID=UPI0013908DDE|nr:OmpA family protein [Ancylobacter sp. TS-1]